MTSSDTANPTLTSLLLPDIDLRNGPRGATFSAGATDIGTGVDYVAISLDRNFQGANGGTNFIFIRDSIDSFVDGQSSLSELFNSTTPSGTYNIESVIVFDKAGNTTQYSTAQLTALGLDTSFVVTSNVASDTSKPVLTSLRLPDVNVSAGSRDVTFGAGATDTGTGVDYVAINLDRNFQGAFGGTDFLFIRDSTDSFADGESSLSELFNSTTPAGTYNIEFVIVFDKAGNTTQYTTAQLAALGIDTSFVVTSNVASDTSNPVLTSLTLPDIDLSGGSRDVTLSAGATDTGTGVDYVAINLDRNVHGPFGGTDFIFIRDSTDSFADGQSSLSQFFNSTTPAGTYNIEFVIVFDKAGNTTQYSTAQLAALGIDTSFVVTSAGSPLPTATVTAPAFVSEGDGSFTISLSLDNVSTATGTVNLSFAADQSTATNGVDVSVPTFSSSYTVTQAPAGPYAITLPAITITDDALVEGVEFVAVRIRLPGQVFANGTDETVVRVELRDNDVAPPSPPAFFLLVPTGAAAQVQGSGTVFGSTSGTQQLSVRDVAGTITFDGSFNTGGDRILLAGPASGYLVLRSGATAQISDGDTIVNVPVGTGGADIVFADGVRTLSLDQQVGAIRLGTQALTTSAVAITAPTGQAVATGATSAMVASQLLVLPGASATAIGRLDVFGTTAGAETVTVAAGARVTLDGSFNAGGDTIVLPGTRTAWTAAQSGATAVLTGVGGESVAIPTGPTATTLRFADGDRSLVLDVQAGRVTLGGVALAPIADAGPHPDFASFTV